MTSRPKRSRTTQRYGSECGARTRDLPRLTASPLFTPQFANSEERKPRAQKSESRRLRSAGAAGVSADHARPGQARKLGVTAIDVVVWGKRVPFEINHFPAA